MRRFARFLLSAVGVLIALAIVDLGPRAAAAYLPSAVASAPAGLDAGIPGDDLPDLPPKSDHENDRLPTPGLHLEGEGNGGMTSSGSGPSSNSPPVAGDLQRTELPADGFVVYYREPPESLDLTAFIDSILDPPRWF